MNFSNSEIKEKRNTIKNLALLTHLKLTYILSIVSTEDEMIGWLVRKFILREANVILQIYKTFKILHIEYCTQVLCYPVSWGCKIH